MAKVTSKLQLTLPKALAEQYGIRPGDELDLTAAGDVVRMTRRRKVTSMPRLQERLHLFDQATERQRRRRGQRQSRREPLSRGWRREDLYHRGRPR